MGGHLEGGAARSRHPLSLSKLFHSFNFQAADNMDRHRTDTLLYRCYYFITNILPYFINNVVVLISLCLAAPLIQVSDTLCRPTRPTLGCTRAHARVAPRGRACSTCTRVCASTLHTHPQLCI